MDLEEFDTFIVNLDTAEQKIQFANLIAISLHNSKSIVTEEFYWELRIIVPIKSNTGIINNNCI